MHRAHRLAEREDHRKGGPRGYDAAKKLKGRKRHLLVDTLGLVIGALVHPANQSEKAGARELLAQLKAQGCPEQLGRLQTIRADGGYGGAPFKDWVLAQCAWQVEGIEKPKDQIGFAVLPKRWVLERTFAWLGRWRRLSKDYEQSPQSSRASILWAMSHLMLKRL